MGDFATLADNRPKRTVKRGYCSGCFRPEAGIIHLWGTGSPRRRRDQPRPCFGTSASATYRLLPLGKRNASVNVTTAR